MAFKCLCHVVPSDISRLCSATIADHYASSVLENYIITNPNLAHCLRPSGGLILTLDSVGYCNVAICACGQCICWCCRLRRSAVGDMEQKNIAGITAREVTTDPEVRCVSGTRSGPNASTARSRNARKKSVRFPSEVSRLTQRDGTAVAEVQKLAVSAHDELRIISGT
jgi:hypothetical protein